MQENRYTIINPKTLKHIQDMGTTEKIKNTLRALTLFVLLAVMAFCLLCEPSADSKHWLSDVVTTRMIGAVTAFGIWRLNKTWVGKEEEI